MPVTVLCPACDSEVSAEKPTGAVQCPTCWARVPLDTAKRKPTDTPPPKAPGPPIPTARPASTPPQAKRAAGPPRERKTQSRRPAEKPKSSIVLWVVASVAIFLAVAAVVSVLLTPPAANVTFNASSLPNPKIPKSNENPLAEEWIAVAIPEGATLFAPGPLRKKAVAVGGDTGASHTASEGDTTAGVSVFDLKGDRRADREEFLGKLLGVSADRVSLHGVKPITGGDATEFTATDATGFDHAGLVLGRGGRWFVFHISWKPDDDPKERRRSQFISRAGVTWLRPELLTDPPKPADPVKPKDTKPADPVKPRDPKTEAEPISETWAAIDTKAGFAAVAPKGVRPERLFVEQKRLPLGGVKWQTEDAHCVYHVSYLDLPGGFEADVPKLVKAVLPFGLDVGADSEGTAGGKKATVWQLKNWDKPRAKAVTVACGFRLFTAFVASKHGKAYGEDATYTQRVDKFTAGLKFTFDPQTDDAYAGEAKWEAVPNAVGFTAKVPKGNTATKNNDLGGNPKILGKHYRTEAGGVVYEVFAHDVPAKRTAADVTKEMLGHDKLVSGPSEVRGTDRRRWTTYELGSPDRPVLFRTATVGSRVYTLRAFPERQGDDRAGVREFRDKAAQFFELFNADE